MELVHGGDLVSAGKIYDGKILDLSVNVNPLGTPPEVIAAAQRAAENAAAYPDPACRELRVAIAARDGVRPEQIFCGNGAAEVIFRLAFALHPRAALLTAPTFAEYEASLIQAGCKCRFHELRREDEFDVTEKILADITPPVELVVLCSPNNPTGRVIPEPLLLRILSRCREIGAALMVDECFLPFVTEGRGLAPWLDKYPELFLLRAFTKTYAIPGLRLGYGLASPELVERLERWGACWNVSGVAQAAGTACCGLPDWPKMGRELISSQRPKLTAGLESLGCEVVHGQANYVLFRLQGVYDLKERMLRRGVLLRSCANYRNLGRDWYRAAVRPQSETEKFLELLAAEIEDK